jgi:signal transduction histidine kinase
MTTISETRVDDENYKPTILIIDDKPANLGILANYLESADYQVLAAQDGETGLRTAQYAQPDLILLDVILPGIDGFELCKRLKTDERTKDIPVIFMTILDKPEDKVKGFAAGGVDYIAKPFQYEEILVRVATHLRIRSLTHKLEAANKSLEKQVEERTAELLKANKALQDEIAERKQAETEREQMLIRVKTQAQQVQHIIETVPDGVLLLGEDGHVRMANSIAEKFFPLLAVDWQNGRLTTVGSQSLSSFLAAPPNGLRHEINVENQIIEVIAHPVQQNLANQEWVLVFRDVTQERVIQRLVQKQDRLAAVGQLAAGIAHDFNNILAVISLYSELLLQMTDLSTEHRKWLQNIDQQSERAGDLIQQILDFSRQSIMESRQIDLLSFFKELIQLLKRTFPENIRIDLIYTDDEYNISADASRIQQVFMNLAVNARDAMPKGGNLTVALDRLQVTTNDTVPILGMQPGQWIQVSITDTGQGIAAENHSRIFEPFFTTKKFDKGTGLGLAQVYGIVQQHQGFIDFQSQEGKGTAFTLYFPSDLVEKVDKTKSDIVSFQKGQGQVILVVEDEPATRQVLVDSLQILNYRAMEAGNGREALTLLEQRHDEIDLILSDAIMPEMGGADLFHAVKEMKLDIPFVIITGHILEKEMETLRASGLSSWLVKPTNLKDLSELLAKLLSSS